MSFWTQLRVWLKVATLSAVVIYLVCFVLKNIGDDKQVRLWVWFYKEPTAPLLIVLPITFFVGVISTLLTRTVFRTLRQLRDMKRRKMEKEAAAIITRAAKLRVREQQDGLRGVAPLAPSDEPLA